MRQFKFNLGDVVRHKGCESISLREDSFIIGRIVECRYFIIGRILNECADTPDGEIEYRARLVTSEGGVDNRIVHLFEQELELSEPFKANRNESPWRVDKKKQSEGTKVGT